LVRDRDAGDTGQTEDPRVIDCLFSMTRVIPTLSQAIALGLSAMQAAQVFFQPGETYSRNPDAFATLPSDGLDTNIYSLFPPLDECGDSPSKFGPEAVHVNTTDDITQEQIDALRAVVAEFPELWEDRIGRVIQPEEDWMQIPLKPGAVLDSKGPYRVSKRDEAAIDEVFDKARADGRLSATEGVCPVGWPVFVVWKNGKARPVVDLRGLNEQTVMDAYPLPRPEDVTGRIQDKYYVAIVDLQKSFYQLWLAIRDRWKTTTLSHRGQESWNVVPTGATGSPSHMQRFMDKLLEKHKEYAKSYIDDVVIFSDDFLSHLQHLRAVFSEFSKAGLTLAPDKCYVGYHSLKVLGHIVDRFGLSTMEDKVSAIASMRFPDYLHELELFIGLSGYYRHFIARYAAIIEPLQRLKTQLLKGAVRKNKRQRSVYTKSKKLGAPSEAQLHSFNAVKQALCSNTVLIHHNTNLPLLIDVDSSVGGGYAAAVHQVPKATMDKENLSLEDILNGCYSRKLERPVTYISKMLNKHEVHYWPTELEIAGIVWTIQKLRHLVEGMAFTKIFTHHQAAADIL
jgi:Reverse transcriptase (RNA-dependent DNA polymerase)/RNase H-like domain found in reverse transcriptase